MSVKLGRIVFRKIGGKIVPLRVGAEAKTIAAGARGVSAKAMRQLKLLQKQTDVTVFRQKLFEPAGRSSYERMHHFLNKTGALRFHFEPTGESIIHIHRKLSPAQRKLVNRLDRSKMLLSNANARNSDLAEPSKLGKLRKFFENKTGKALEKKAKAHFGTTNDLRETGFVLRNGELIDLSGKKFGGSSRTRELDHREVTEFVNPLKRLSDRDISNRLKEAKDSRKQVATYLQRLRTKKK